MINFGIEISEEQKNFSFKAARAEGVRCVLLKADSAFPKYYDLAKASRLSVGVYAEGKAATAAEAQAEADALLAAVNQRTLDFPIFYKVGSQMPDSAVILAFCERIMHAGYEVGICSGDIELPEDLCFTRWIVKTGWSKPKHGCAIWQYGTEVNYIRSNRVASQVCGQLYCYKSFAPTAAVPKPKPDPIPIPEQPQPTIDEIIFGKPKETIKKSNQEIAQEVAQGLWGPQGDERKKKLRDAGYNPSVIQRIVNKLLVS